MKKIVAAILLSGIASVSQAGTYTGKIDQIQAEGIGDGYNTVYLKYDVTDSQCDSTNTHNRFVIINEVQQTVALAALLAGKTVQLMSKDICNAGGIDEVNYIKIYSDQ